MNNNTLETVNPAKHSGMITLAYVLFGVGLFTAHFTSIIGVIIAYIKRDDLVGTYLHSHCSWLIGVFWWSLLWNIVGWATFWFGLGFVVWGIVWVWTAYKLIKGFLRVHAEQAV